MLFPAVDANWDWQDHHPLVFNHLISTGTSRDRQAGVLHTHCARDGEGPAGAEGAGRLPLQVHASFVTAFLTISSHEQQATIAHNGMQA